jgi:Flp pilus assembly pilin Flp
MAKFTTFLKDETGAVTVDWVVLTAAIVGLGLLVFTFIRPGVESLSEAIETEMGESEACLTSNGTTCP